MQHKQQLSPISEKKKPCLCLVLQKRKRHVGKGTSCTPRTLHPQHAAPGAGVILPADSDPSGEGVGPPLAGNVHGVQKGKVLAGGHFIL